MFPLLTERLLIRPWQPGDFEALVEINSDPEVMRYIGGGGPLTREQTRASFERQQLSLASRGYCKWALELRESPGIIGRCGLEDFLDGEVEMGWRLAKNYWGQGLATEAALRVKAFAFETLRLPRIIAIAHPPNTASIRIMQKLGMTFEKLTEFMGVQMVYYAVQNPNR